MIALLVLVVVVVGAVLGLVADGPSVDWPDDLR
jgi:hypothetical protein